MDREGELARALAVRGAPPLAALEWPERLGSTSDRLKDLARRGAPEWTVVLADEQTAGRGREGRPWLSPRGGLYLSVLLRPRSLPLGVLPLAAGVAVAEAIAEHGVAARLKWPNDVLLEGRKLAGILAEAASGPQGAEWVVLGIGVNRLQPERLPADLADRVAWLAGAGAATPEPATLAAAVLARLRVWYDALASSPASVVETWRALAVPWWGERIELQSGGETVRGRLLGVDGEGALLLGTESGRTRRIVSGEVRGVRRDG